MNNASLLKQRTNPPFPFLPVGVNMTHSCENKGPGILLLKHGLLKIRGADGGKCLTSTQNIATTWLGLYNRPPQKIGILFKGQLMK